MADTKIDAFDMSAGTPEIQGEMRPTAPVADRISKRVIMVVLGLVAVMAIIFMVSLDAMDKPKEKKVAEKETVVLPNENLKDESLGLTGTDPSPAGAIKPKGEPKSEPQGASLVARSVPSPATIPAGAGAVPPLGDIPPPAPKVLTLAEQQAVTEQQARYARTVAARNSGLVAKSFGAAAAVGAGAADTASGNDMSSLMMNYAKAQMAGAGGVGGAQKADGEQESKLDFLKAQGAASNSYHPNTALAALSPNEIKIGAFIPMVLEQSINSDLPGQITARVTEDVYDTITGCRLLIPAMSKVIGRYDSKIAIGQGRMLVAWNSMVFPDGAELNLGGMQGYDSSGAAGLESDVDNHYLRLFGITFGMSMVTTAVTLSVPAPNPGLTGAQAPPTPAQTLSTSLAQQYGTLGAQILGKYMAVQPTLRNYAGERFIVMVPRTVVLRKVWRSRCSG